MAAQHCDQEDAVQIFEDVGAEAAIGMHWGTSKRTDETPDDPERRLAAALQERGIDPGRFVAMHPADVADFG